MPDGAVPLAEAALLLACEEYPQLEISPYLDRLDEIADFVVFLLSERSGVVTGSVIDWDQSIPGAHE